MSLRLCEAFALQICRGNHVETLTLQISRGNPCGLIRFRGTYLKALALLVAGLSHYKTSRQKVPEP